MSKDSNDTLSDKLQGKNDAKKGAGKIDDYINPLDTYNDGADFWRYRIGANIIPADTQRKRPLVEWQQWQDKPIPEEVHAEWRKKQLFDNGMAVITGRIWHRQDRQELYLNCIDIDNAKGIEELCTLGDKAITLERLAKRTLVEQHLDDPGKAHVYVYSRHPYAKKSSDNIDREIAAKMKANEIPAFEVKGLGAHGVMFCTPSIHKGGHPYQIVGTNEPAVTEELEKQVDSICKKYGIDYLDSNRNGKLLVPIAELFKEETLILEGHNRHEALLRVMESLLLRNKQVLSPDEVRGLSEKWNEKHCLPPLSHQEVEKQWKCAVNFIDARGGTANPKSETRDDRSYDGKTQSLSKAQTALDIVKKNCSEFFVDEHQQAYAVANVNDHQEVLPLSSRRFKNWLAMIHHEKTGTILIDNDVNNMLNIVQAEALFKGREQKLELRVATAFKAGSDNPVAFYYDLINRNWQCIEVTADGWAKRPCPILFKRYAVNSAQVEPSREYPSDVLDQFLALTNVVRPDWLIVKCYILSAFMSEMPKPVLMPYGEKGSAKTTFQRLIKRLVDPSSVEFLSIPHERNQLVQNLSHNYLAYYDNVSSIPNWLSDEFCRAVTGGGLSKRKLYEDDDDVTYSFRRAIGFNGINLAASQPDLLDRGISILLERIQRSTRKGEKEIWTTFECLLPGLLGYIMDTLVKVLQRWDSVKLSEYPRMADFARFGELAARCMSYPDGAFMAAYNANIGRHSKEAIAASPVASVIVKFMESNKRFDGTVSELLAILEPIATQMKWNTKGRHWPSSPQALGRRLNEVKSDLRDEGIIVDRPEDKSTNVVKVMIEKSDNAPGVAGRPSHTTGQDETPLPKIMSVPSSTTPIPCPYCTSHFSCIEDSLRHSINIHPRRPFAQDMAKLGFTI
jgi:hypothetical protein